MSFHFIAIVKYFMKKHLKAGLYKCIVGGAVVLWLVHSTRSERSEFEPWPDSTLCCVLGQDTLTVPLSTQMYKWVPANFTLEVTLPWTSIQGGVESSRFMQLKPG